jgi:1-phosphofructokinase
MSGYTSAVDVDRGSVAVFAPTPLLNMMIEPGAEQPEIHLHAGGQGPWIANMLAVLEARTILCTAFGGETGQVLQVILERDRIEVRGVPAAGSSGCDVEDRRSGNLECVATMRAPRLDRHESDELCNILLAAGLETGIVVLTGPMGGEGVHPDTYRRVAADLTRLGVTVVADLSGDQLESALDGGVSALKVSDEDLGKGDAVKVAESLRERTDAVVLTRGSAPALLFADSLCSVRVPALQTVDHRGAGDSMTAGIAAGLARGYTLAQAVQLGAAAGAVNVTRHGLASGRRDTIEKLAEQVVIETATKEEVRDARTGHQ